MTLSRPGIVKQGFLTRILPDIPKEDRLALFMLALFVGGYSFLALVSVFLPAGWVERDETLTFILGWMLAPTCGLLSVPLFVWIRQEYLKQVSNILQILLMVNSLLFAVFITAMNFSWQITKSASLPTFLVLASLLIVPLANLSIILILKRTDKNYEPPLGWMLFLCGVGLLNFVGLFPYFGRQYSASLQLLVISILVGVSAFEIKWPEKFHIQSRFGLVGIDIVIILLGIALCFDPALRIEPLHENFYLGPTNRILHGGTMLVDAFSQYGILSIYFLAFVFKIRMIPFTYQGLSLLIAVLFMAHFSIVYFLLRVLVKDRSFAILLWVLALLLGFFGPFDIIQAYPSTGPFRFGITYLVLTIVFLRTRYPRLRRIGLISEYLLVCLAFLWSFESFVYTVFPYLGICLYDCFKEHANFTEALKFFIRRLVYLLIALAASNGLFSVITYARSAAWPDWAGYLDFIRAYSINGFGTLLIDPWSPWIFPLIIYFTSLMVFLFRAIFLKSVDGSPQGELVFGLTLMGIAQYTYYLGRSHPNNLYHISTPAVIVGGYWMDQLIHRKDFPVALRSALKFTLFASSAFIILSVFPIFLAKYQTNHTGISLGGQIFSTLRKDYDLGALLAAERALLLNGSQDPHVSEALGLFQKYTPGQKDATVFLSPVNTTEILMKAGRIHRFPISDVVEDSVSTRITQKLLEYPHGLHENDIIFLEQDPSAYQDRLQIQLVGRLCQEFAFQEIEQTSTGVSAIRLQPFNGQRSVYCDRIRKYNRVIHKQ